MSKEKAEKEPKAKGKSPMMLIIIVAVLMLAVGGGGAFALVEFGIIGGGGKEKVKEDNSPKLIKKGEVDPFAPKAEGGKEGEGGGKEVEGEGGSPYKTSYYTFTEDFTSNLKESSALVQVSVACSTHRDGRVLMWLKKHELAVRSAILNVLADTPEDEIQHIEGKEKLQKRLTAAINKVLVAEEGFGGIDEVYFKSFIVQ
jgi:flagellar FliL protein